jgi:hypothetical protein
MRAVCKQHAFAGVQLQSILLIFLVVKPYFDVAPDVINHDDTNGLQILSSIPRSI